MGLMERRRKEGRDGERGREVLEVKRDMCWRWSRKRGCGGGGGTGGGEDGAMVELAEMEQW